MLVRNLVIAVMHLVIAAALAAVAATCVQSILGEALHAARAETLQTYIRMRGEREQAVFDRAQTFILAATATSCSSCARWCFLFFPVRAQSGRFCRVAFREQ